MAIAAVLIQAFFNLKEVFADNYNFKGRKWFYMKSSLCQVKKHIKR